MIYGLQGLHVLFAIVWFGGVVCNDFVVVPAVSRIDPQHGNVFLVAYGQIIDRVMTVAAIVTISLGILLGFPLGAWANIGHTYGNTYLAALIVALGVFTWGVTMVGPNAKRLASLTPGSDEFGRTLDAVKRNAFLELFGFLSVFALMVALQFGY